MAHLSGDADRGSLPNFFTINGKAYPATDTVEMKLGQTNKVRLIGSNNNFVHLMHIHGGSFEVVARDGFTLAQSARYMADGQCRPGPAL